MSNKEELIRTLQAKIRNMQEDSPTGGYTIRPRTATTRQEMIRNYNRNVVGNWKESK